MPKIRCGAGAGLAHLADNETQLANGEKDIDQVEAEFLPFTEGERAVDQLATAEIKHGGLAQIGDQEDEGEQEAENTSDPDLLIHQIHRQTCQNVLALAARV